MQRKTGMRRKVSAESRRLPTEPPRLSRRLHLVRRGSCYGKTFDTLSGGGSRPGCPAGFRASGRAWLAMGGDVFDRGGSFVTRLVAAQNADRAAQRPFRLGPMALDRIPQTFDIRGGQRVQADPRARRALDPYASAEDRGVFRAEFGGGVLPVRSARRGPWPMQPDRAAGCLASSTEGVRRAGSAASRRSCRGHRRARPADRHC